MIENTSCQENIYMAPTEQTVKRLFALSGNVCAFPNCEMQLVNPTSETVIGDICHIKGKKKGSARYDRSQADDMRDSFENLILMCPNHHREIDADERRFTVDYLRRIKAEHEAKHANGREPDDDVVRQFLPQPENKVVINGSVIQTINQSGGQVARRIINIGPQRRRLTTAQRKAMNPFLEKMSGRPVALAHRFMDGESRDYATELNSYFSEVGCQVLEIIPTSLNDFVGYVVISPHGNSDNEIPEILQKAFNVAGIDARIETAPEGSLGNWYDDVVHVIVGRAS